MLSSVTGFVHSNQDKYGVFWYNDHEILTWAEADYEAKAADLAAAGITHVMTFSSTHFRWSFYPYWDKITEAIRKIVSACHRYNIKVIEHHSSQLTHAPWDSAQWDALDVELSVRYSKLDNWPGLKEFIAFGDPEIRPGVKLSQCRQIDGRTGYYVRSPYNGWCHCYNNPHFRAAYFDYLATLYKTGIDGIMTDDVHFFGDGSGCTCKYCQEKFTKETGYTLPPRYQWSLFDLDFNNPVFVAWRKFRLSSLEEFQRAVNAHARSLGYTMMRPNYTTTTFNCCLTAYPFESAGDLWSHVFQENMFSSVKRSAWPSWCGIALHRSAMARKYHSQPMSMFYPFRYDDYYFCWSLSKLWEHILMATPEGKDMNDVEKEFIAFDKRYPRIKNNLPLADMAFLQPRSSLDFGPDSLEGSSRPLSVWMQAALFRNFQGAILFENDPLEVWQKYPYIVVAGANVLSDELLKQMKAYIDQGGRLLIFGAFGQRRMDGSLREHPESAFGLNAQLSPLESLSAGSFIFNEKQLGLPAVEESRYFLTISGGSVISSTDDGKILGIAACNGHLLWLAGGVRSRTPKASHYALNISRWSREPGRAVEAPPYAADMLYHIPGEILAMTLPESPWLRCSCHDYLLTAYADLDQKKCVIHCMNVSGTLARPPAKISHDDPFPRFMPHAAKNSEEISIRFRIPDGMLIQNTAVIASPEFEGTMMLPVRISDATATLVIPAGNFSGYLRIEIPTAHTTSN